MDIKHLSTDTLKDAIAMKVDLWQEELNYRFEHSLDFNEEYDFWADWMKNAEAHNDVRTLLGAFDQEILTGSVFASFAEVDDALNAVEINGLWVKKPHRGKQIGLKLLREVLLKYHSLNCDKVIIYNHKYAPSNALYHALGGEIIRTDEQLDGKLIVDVFSFDLNNLLKTLNTKIKTA